MKLPCHCEEHATKQSSWIAAARFAPLAMTTGEALVRLA
jgi:hypothetical protein